MAETTIADLARRGHLVFGDGYRTKRSEHGKPGYRILRVADVGDGSLDLSGPDFVRREFARSIGPKLSVAGDVLLTTKGTVGRVAIYPPGAEQVVYSPQLCYFRVLDAEEIHPRFLAYWFRSEAFRRQALHRANNTDMAPYINLRDIASLTLDLPDRGTQQAIAEVLGALDDKIAANHRVITASDALAEARFDAAESRQEVALSGLARFVNGKPFTKNATGTGRVVIRIAELNSGLGGSTVYNDLEVPDDHIARPGDLLFAWSGSLTVTRWYRPEAIVNQHIFKVIPNAGVPMWFVAQSVKAKLAEFRAIASDKATTMGHIQRHHLDLPVSVPDPQAVAAMDSMMTALWDVSLAREVENLRLVTTRDDLLPLLMSGKVRVRDAEKRVEEVL